MIPSSRYSFSLTRLAAISCAADVRGLVDAGRCGSLANLGLRLPQIAVAFQGLKEIAWTRGLCGGHTRSWHENPFEWCQWGSREILIVVSPPAQATFTVPGAGLYYFCPCSFWC